MSKCIEKKECGLLVCMGDYERFEQKLGTFDTTPPFKGDVLSLSSNDSFCYSGIARALGVRPVFINDQAGVNWDEVERIVSDFEKRGCVSIDALAKKEMMAMGKAPDSECDAAWETDKEYRVSKLLKRELEMDARLKVPSPEL